MRRSQKQNKFYVYLHKRLDGTPFYVGKGCGNRAYTKNYRNDDWHKEAANGYNVEIVKDNLYERDSYELEKKLIREIGITNLTNLYTGGGGVKVKTLIDEAWEKLEELGTIFDIYYNFEKYNKTKYFREWFGIICATDLIKTDINNFYATKHRDNDNLSELR